MARQRLTRKEIKQPDSFITNTVHVVDWVKDHARQVLYSVAGIVVVIALLIAWSSIQRHRKQKAEILLYQAVKVLKEDVGGANKPASDGEAREAALRQLERVARDYRGTTAAGLAYWHLGHAAFAKGDYTKALVSYEQVERLLSGDPQHLVPALITLNIGYAQEASGACERAIPSFEKVVASSIEWLHGEAFLGIGRCYETAGALDKAKALYARALSDDAVGGGARQRVEERWTHLKFLQARDDEASSPSANKTEKPETADTAGATTTP